MFSFRKELVDRLIEEKHEVLLCVESTEKIIKTYSNKVSKIIDVRLNLKDKGILSNLKLKKRYKQIIKNEKPDLIISYKIKPNIYCGLYSKNVPMIANITGLGNLFKKDNLASKIGVFLYKKSFKNVKYVFFQNADGLNFFKKHKIKVNNYRIVPGSGVNVERFVPLKLNDSTIVNFLFASRAIKEKGIDLMLDAIPRVIQQNTNVHFNFLSAEEDILRLDKAKEVFSKYKDYITLLDRTDNISEVYVANDFLVSPSFYREGISNVLIESLACGRPIITTKDNPGCMEVLEDGINGLGILSNDLETLVDAMVKASLMSKSKIAEMGNAGREFVVQNFDRNIVINNYMDVIGIIEKENI